MNITAGVTVTVGRAVANVAATLTAMGRNKPKYVPRRYLPKDRRDDFGTDIWLLPWQVPIEDPTGRHLDQAVAQHSLWASLMLHARSEPAIDTTQKIQTLLSVSRTTCFNYRTGRAPTRVEAYQALSQRLGSDWVLKDLYDREHRHAFAVTNLRPPSGPTLNPAGMFGLTTTTANFPDTRPGRRFEPVDTHPTTADPLLALTAAMQHPALRAAVSDFEWAKVSVEHEGDFEPGMYVNPYTLVQGALGPEEDPCVYLRLYPAWYDAVARARRILIDGKFPVAFHEWDGHHPVRIAAVRAVPVAFEALGAPADFELGAADATVVWDGDNPQVVWDIPDDRPDDLADFFALRRGSEPTRNIYSCNLTDLIDLYEHDRGTYDLREQERHDRFRAESNHVRQRVMIPAGEALK